MTDSELMNIAANATKFIGHEPHPENEQEMLIRTTIFQALRTVCDSVSPQVVMPSEGLKVSIWGMYDNHTFHKYHGDLYEIIEAWKKDDVDCLCPAILLSGEKEIRRVGEMVHDKTNLKALEKYRTALLNDPDISRILFLRSQLKPVQPISDEELTQLAELDDMANTETMDTFKAGYKAAEARILGGTK